MGKKIKPNYYMVKKINKKLLFGFFYKIISYIPFLIS